MNRFFLALLLVSTPAVAADAPPAEEAPPTEVPEPEPEDVPSQTLNLKAVGLWVTDNPLEAPPGSLLTADNAVLRRRNIVESRRGQAPDAPTPDDSTINTLTAFEGSVIAHTSTDKIVRRDSSSAMTALTGTYAAPDGAPVRFWEAGGGLYFTTDAGPYRLDSPSGTPEAAGVPPGLEGSGATTGASGWLANGTSTGYRLVWGKRDGDGALLLGAPSGRITVSNSSGGTRDVALTTPIPDGIVAGTHFLQVYRTVNEAASVDDLPEDYAQVAEVFPTSADLTAGTVTITDISSFAAGPSGYFSQNTGEGLISSKLQPPLITDATVYKGYTFAVVRAYLPVFTLTLTAIGGTDGLADNDRIAFLVTGDWEEKFVASTSQPEGTELVANVWTYVLETGGTVAANLEATARSLARVINLKSNHLYASYGSGPDDLPGAVFITQRALPAQSILASAEYNARPWVPAMKQFIPGTAVRAANVVTVTTAYAHHLAIGDVISLPDPVDPVNFPAGNKTVATVPTSLTFTYNEVGANASSGENYETLDPYAEFTQEATPGSWAHSAFEEYDAWPPRFRFQTGGPNVTLYRIIRQADALLFWTSEGLYRLTGTDETDFTLRPVDATVKLVGQNTPVSMGNRAYALTDQGVVSVSDLGVEKISEPVDAALLPFYSGSAELLAAIEDVGFGVGYDSENEYILFLPSADGDEGDPATQAYAYNSQTRAWSRWEFPWTAQTGDTNWVSTAFVPPAESRVYVAHLDRLSRERKDRSLSDYVEPGGGGVPVDIAYQVQTANNAGLYKNWIEATYLLESAQPASVGLYFATETDTAEEGGTVSTQGNLAVRTYIPLNKSRSARLTAGITHSTASERLSLLGLSVVYNEASQLVGR